MIDPLIPMLIGVGFAGLLLPSAWHKVLDTDAFAHTLRDYRLLPSAWSRPAVVLLAAVETALGLAWLSGTGRNAVALATTILMLTYASAIAVNLVRGRVHIDCGCGFGAASAGNPSLSWRQVARNVALALLTLVGALPAAGRNLGMYDWLTLFLAIVGGTSLLGAAAQLLRNHAATTWSRHRD